MTDTVYIYICSHFGKRITNKFPNLGAKMVTGFTWRAWPAKVAPLSQILPGNFAPNSAITYALYPPPRPSFRCMKRISGHMEHLLPQICFQLQDPGFWTASWPRQHPGIWQLEQKCRGKPIPSVPDLGRMSQLTPVVSTSQEAARRFCETANEGISAPINRRSKKCMPCRNCWLFSM